MESPWTVLIERGCPECSGRGELPTVEEQSGRKRTVTTGGSCPACEGQGVERKRIDLSELREMLDAGQ